MSASESNYLGLNEALQKSTIQEPFRRLAHHVLVTGSFLTNPLDRIERETIAAFVSSINCCGFCLKSHAAVIVALHELRCSSVSL